MAALERWQFAEIRAWVGDTPTNEDLQNRFDDTGGTTLVVARQVLQQRLGDLTSGPDTFSAEGDYSESNKDVMATLRQQIKDLSLIIEGQTIPGYVPTANQTTPAHLTRDDRERLNGVRGTVITYVSG